MAKALGIVRKMDELGRVVIPMEVRRTRGWGERQPLEMFMEGDALVIKAYGKEDEKKAVLDKLTELHKKADQNSDDQKDIEEVMKFIQK